jgi:microsomal epoxide hydrolase
MTIRRRGVTLVAAMLAVIGTSRGVAAVEAKRAFVTAPDGVRIHVVQAGAGEAPAVLLVPGWTMPAEIFRPQIEHLAGQFRVVAMDPRCQGESGQTGEGLYPAARARDIKAVVDELKLAPVVLVGWSMGVAEALAFVEQFGASTLAGLVLVDGIAGADWDPVVSPAMVRWIGSFQRERAKTTDGFVRSMYRKPQDEAYVKRIIEQSLRMPTSAAVALFVGTMTSDYRPVLAKLDRPTLLAVAPGPFTARYQEMARAIPGVRIEVFEDAGHALFVDDAERFNALLDSFLAGVHAAR